MRIAYYSTGVVWGSSRRGCRGEGGRVRSRGHGEVWKTRGVKLRGVVAVRTPSSLTAPVALFAVGVNRDSEGVGVLCIYIGPVVRCVCVYACPWRKQRAHLPSVVSPAHIISA